jgi:hypothetical protein
MHLVVAPGVRAIEQGFSVAFYRLEELLHEMRKDAAVPPQALRRKKYPNVAYLVVGEVRFEPMSLGGRQPVLPPGQLPLQPRQHAAYSARGRTLHKRPQVVRRGRPGLAVGRSQVIQPGPTMCSANCLMAGRMVCRSRL